MRVPGALSGIHRFLLPAESGFLPYLWLVFLACYFLPGLVEPIGLRQWLWNLAALLVFLGLYFRTHWASWQELLTLQAGMCVLGVLLAPHYYGALVFFIYAACSSGGVPRPRLGFAAVLAIVALVPLVTWWWTLSWWFFAAPAVLFGGTMGIVSVLTGEVERKNRQIRLSQEEVRHLATSAERERIARDLHDLMGHTLSVIAAKSELAAKLLDRDPARAQREAEDLQRISRQALSDVREAISGYRRSSLAEELASARLALESADIRFDCRLPAEAISEEEGKLLAPIVREAATNVLRHSSASHCWAQFQRRDGGLTLEFRDNGTVDQPVREGNGMRGMRERVTLAGGEFGYRAEEGLILTIRVPEGLPT